MLWCSMTELSLCLGLILIILYGLFSMSVQEVSVIDMKSTFSGSTKMVNLHLNDVYFFSRLWPVMLLLGYAIDFELLNKYKN